MAEQQITGQQIAEAVQIAADCCARCEKPATSTMSNWEWADTTRAAANILAAVARDTLDKAAVARDTAAAAEPPAMEIPVVDDAESVSVNGEQ